jgi:hypothetical protein
MEDIGADGQKKDQSDQPEQDAPENRVMPAGTPDRFVINGLQIIVQHDSGRIDFSAGRGFPGFFLFLRGSFGTRVLIRRSFRLPGRRGTAAEFPDRFFRRVGRDRGRRIFLSGISGIVIDKVVRDNGTIIRHFALKTSSGQYAGTSFREK